MSAADKPVEDLESHFWPHSCPLANLFVDIVFTSSIQQLSFEFVVNIFIKLEFVAIVFIKLEFVTKPYNADFDANRRHSPHRLRHDWRFAFGDSTRAL